MTTDRGKQTGLARTAALAGAAVLALTGCASAGPQVGQPGRPGSTAGPGVQSTGNTGGPAIHSTGSTARPAAQSGCSAASGFALSLASGEPGWDSPVQAAQQFSRQGDPAGYGTSSTVWTAGTPNRSGVTLTAAQLSLHAVRLPNGRWAIDSGQRCG